MEKHIFTIIFLIISQLLHSQTYKLTIRIEGLKNTKGNLLVGLYNNGSNFPDKKYAFAGKVLPIKNKMMNFSFESIEKGTLAVAVIHDEDADGELSTNFIGIPTEGFGFSNNAMGIFGPPSFKKASVNLIQNKKIVIKLRN